MCLWSPACGKILVDRSTSHAGHHSHGILAPAVDVRAPVHGLRLVSGGPSIPTASPPLHAHARCVAATSGASPTPLTGHVCASIVQPGSSGDMGAAGRAIRPPTPPHPTPPLLGFAHIAPHALHPSGKHFAILGQSWPGKHGATIGQGRKDRAAPTSGQGSGSGRGQRQTAHPGAQ